MRLQELAESIGARLKGDPNCMISGLAALDAAGPNDLAFLTNTRYRKYLGETRAAAVLLAPEDEALCARDDSSDSSNDSKNQSSKVAIKAINLLIAENPRLALAKVAALFEKHSVIPPGIHPTAVIGSGCNIHSTAAIGPLVVIGSGVSIAAGVVIGAGSCVGDNSVIGTKTILKPKVTLYERVRLGESCLIHSGAVIGSDGFGFAHDGKAWVKMPHLGGVVIGNNVEIGANTTVDRGFLEDTCLGNGVIIDNLVQVGHNVSIGDFTAIAACVAIAGSTNIGKYCLIGGAACIAGHLDITDRVSITATTGVNSSINESGVYSAGLPAKPNHVWRKNAARFQYLDEMAKRIRALEKALEREAERQQIE